VLLNWQRPEKGDSLHGWCAAFGIEVSDVTTGEDIGAAVEAGDTETIIAHCASDCSLTTQLYHRLTNVGII
jgi:hypothetical protein